MSRIDELRMRLIETAQRDAWRFRLWDYARTCSNGRWNPYRALVYIADIIQQAIRKGGGRIIVNIPPRHGKSVLISFWLPIWFLDWYPEKHVITTSYGDRLASRWGRRARDEVRTNKKIWNIIGRKANENSWETEWGGGMITAGVGGPILGSGGDLFLIDDPYKNKAEAFSETYRRRVEDWFESTAYSRLEPNATVVVIMQRWHEDDFCGYLKNSHSDSWTHINLPALAEENDQLGRAVGEALIPERYDEATLARIREAVGSLFWSSMYQQRPAPLEGNIIKRDWFQYFKEWPKAKRIVISWDMDFKKTGKSWCVGQAWSNDQAKNYLMDQVRFKADFTTALARLVQFHNSAVERWGSVHETLIEQAANGYAIIDTIKGKIPCVKPIIASTSKLERLSSAAPSIECGDVFLPHRSLAPWVGDLVEELVAFPNGRDDQCDALSQYVIRYKSKKIGSISLNLSVGVSGTPEHVLQ